MKIGNIDLTKKILLVAEIGSNHEGDFESAKAMINQAAQAGADAVKFQTYHAEDLVRKDIPALGHVRSLYKYQYERFKSLEFTGKQYNELHELCGGLGCIFLSTPFDKRSVDVLNPLVPAFKIASGDITHLPLLKYVADKQKPVILSTGLATESEIEAALNILGEENVVLLHCVSKYPTAAKDANLLTIPYLRDRFGVLVGYSDHTVGNSACEAAAALGAVVIEKHFTMDKTISHGDHRLSADPFDLMAIASNIRRTEVLLGTYGRVPNTDKAALSAMRRGAVTAVRLKQGDIVTEEKVKFVRPAEGISPDKIGHFLGRAVNRDLEEGVVLFENFFD